MDVSHVMEMSLEAMTSVECEPNIFVCPSIKGYSTSMMTVERGVFKFSVNASVWHEAMRCMKDVDFCDMFVGYGTGGAVALALAVINYIDHKAKAAVCSFGAPAIGDHQFNKLCRHVDHIRVRHQGDSLPQQNLWCRHACRAVQVGGGSVSCIEKMIVRAAAHAGCFITPIPFRTYVEECERYLCSCDSVLIS